MPARSVAAAHRPQRRDEGRLVEAAGDAHRVRQVGRADEQDVDAVEGGDLGGVLDGERRLDLEHADDRRVQPRDVGVGDLTQLGAARREGEATDALRRVAEVRQRLADFVDGLEPRDHDPGRSQVIERSPDPEPLAGLRPDDRGRVVADRVELTHQLRFRAGAVLEIDDQPVEIRPGRGAPRGSPIRR